MKKKGKSIFAKNLTNLGEEISKQGMLQEGHDNPQSGAKVMDSTGKQMVQCDMGQKEPGK